MDTSKGLKKFFCSVQLYNYIYNGNDMLSRIPLLIYSLGGRRVHQKVVHLLGIGTTILPAPCVLDLTVSPTSFA